MEAWKGRWFEGEMLPQIAALILKSPHIQTKEEAKSLLQQMAKIYEEILYYKADRALTEAKLDIGYFGGYFPHSKREAMEELFDVEHPLFGRFSKVGPVDPKEAFRLGMTAGKDRRKEKLVELEERRRRGMN
jgi:hypothetical protein